MQTGGQPCARHLFESQLGRQEPDGLGGACRAGCAQLRPDELLQGNGLRTDVPPGGVRELDRPHHHRHLGVSGRRLAHLRQGLADGLVQRGDLLAAHRPRVIREPEELESSPGDLTPRNRDDGRHGCFPRGCDTPASPSDDDVTTADRRSHTLFLNGPSPRPICAGQTVGGTHVMLRALYQEESRKTERILNGLQPRQSGVGVEFDRWCLGRGHCRPTFGRLSWHRLAFALVRLHASCRKDESRWRSWRVSMVRRCRSSRPGSRSGIAGSSSATRSTRSGGCTGPVAGWKPSTSPGCGGASGDSSSRPSTSTGCRERLYRTIAASGIEEGTVYLQITRGVARGRTRSPIRPYRRPS